MGNSAALRQKLKEGQVLLGVSHSYPAAGIIEGMCRGWDVVWIDVQHGEHSYDSVEHTQRAAEVMGIDTLLRVPTHDPLAIVRYADLAPSAIMVPMVDHEDQAKQIATALCFPPLGNRSYGGRRTVDLHGRNYHTEPGPLVVAQIESIEAAEAASQIARVEGIDMLFFGPDDMKLRMGIPVETPPADDPRLLDAMRATAEAARQSGKFVGTTGATPETIQTYAAMGYQLLIGGGDFFFLHAAAAQTLDELRSALANRRKA